MSDLHTPFIGGTGLNRPREDRSADELTTPFVPGEAPGQAVSEPEITPEPSVPVEEAIDSVFRSFEAAPAPAPAPVSVPAELSETEEPLAEEPAPEAGADPESSEFPEFLFGLDSGDSSPAVEPAEALETTQDDLGEQIRELAETLRGENEEEIVARAFAAGYRAAKSKEEA